MDQAVFHLINERWTSPALDLFMAAVSDVEIWKPLLVVVGLYALIFGGFKGRAFVLCLALILTISGTMVVRTLKSAVGRMRPKQVQVVRMVQLERATPKFLTLFKQPTIRYSNEKDRKSSGPSFPSGHVTDNVIIAMCCTFFFGRWGALIGSSRRLSATRAFISARIGRAMSLRPYSSQSVKRFCSSRFWNGFGARWRNGGSQSCSRGTPA
jgi:membrane-associated phospholipid phosphatase